MADEEVFTYDDLYELLREELSLKDLQKLELSSLKKIKKYMNSKKDLLKKAKSSKFSKEKRRLSEEIENARQILIKINQKRTKKIINRAIFTVRSESGAKDTSNMLPFEEALYEKLIKDLKNNDDEFFSTINNLKVPKIKKKETKELKREEKEKETKKDNNLKEIRVLEDIPELTGPDLKNYGPYKKGDVAELPAELAVLIINKGKGREMK